MAIVLSRSADGSLTLPAELLDEMQHSKYAFRSENGDLVLTPTNGSSIPPSVGTDLEKEWDAWFIQLAELGERMSAKWPEGVTAVDAVNAIRR